MAPKARFATIPNSPNLQRAYQVLTDGTMSQWSGGRIPKMTAVQAAGFLGALTHEHGRWDWSNLDVIEKGSGRGRGVAQFTDNWDGSAGRRTAYEAARKQAVASGVDPNTIDFQMRYIAEEYAGKWDSAVGGKSLAGWTKALDKIPTFKNVKDAVMYFTGSVESRKGYLRPVEKTAHYDRRIDAATQIFSNLGKPQAPAKAPAKNKPAIPQGPLEQIMNKLGINKGKQSFDTEKLGRVLGEMATNPNMKSDVGLAIFASSTKGNVVKKWNQLGKSQKQAWRTVGGQLGIQQMMQTTAPTRTYSMPKQTSVGPNKTYGPKGVDLSIGGLRPGDLGYGSNNTKVGGLPGLHDIAQAGIANYGYFKDKSNKYGQAAFGANSSSWANTVNQYSYGSGMNLGKSLGINTSATAAAGSKYGGAAMSMNTSANVAASYGKQ